jgi:hypothetical protein
MSNNDPKRESELDDFRRALTKHGLTQAHMAPQESAMDRFKAALGDAAERSTGWVASQMHTAGQDLVSRVLLGESYTEPADKHQEPERDEGLER